MFQDSTNKTKGNNNDYILLLKFHRNCVHRIMRPCAAGYPRKIFAGVCRVYGKRHQNHLSGQP